MVFRCKRYRIVEVTRNVPRRWHVERVFVVQRRWFGWLWLRQRVSQIYFGFPLCWLRGQFKFRSVEAAADALCGWLRATCKPDDYTIYITLPDSILPPSPLQLGVATTQKQMNEMKDFLRSVGWRI